MYDHTGIKVLSSGTTVKDVAGNINLSIVGLKTGSYQLVLAGGPSYKSAKTYTVNAHEYEVISQTADISTKGSIFENDTFDLKSSSLMVKSLSNGQSQYTQVANVALTDKTNATVIQG